MNEKDTKTVLALLIAQLVEPKDVQLGGGFIRKALTAIKRFRYHDPSFNEAPLSDQIERVIAAMVIRASGSRCKEDEHRRRRDLLVLIGARDAIAVVIEQTNPRKSYRRLGHGSWR